MNSPGFVALVAAVLVVVSACGAVSEVESGAPCTPTTSREPNGVTRLTTRLTGAAVARDERSHPGSGVTAPEPNQGDPDGTGCVTVTVDLGKLSTSTGGGTRVAEGGLCYELVAQKIDAVQAVYVRRDTAGTNGPIATVLFSASPWTPVPDVGATLRGCSGPQDGCSRTPCLQDVIRDMAEIPDRFFVQVFTGAYPHDRVIGALRGQFRGHG